MAALGRWRTRHSTTTTTTTPFDNQTSQKSLQKGQKPHSDTLTCFQVPEVFTTDLVVPGFTITVAAAPYIESRIDGHGTVASTGPRDVVFEGIHQHGLPTHGVYKQTRGKKINSSEGRFAKTSSN